MNQMVHYLWYQAASCACTYIYNFNLEERKDLFASYEKLENEQKKRKQGKTSKREIMWENKLFLLSF